MAQRPSTSSQPAAAQDTPVNGVATDVWDLSVVIVNYNVREFLEQALRSVERASGGLRVEVFVVDNNSVDGSVEMVRERFPEVQLIANEQNVGFGAANNQAIRQARGRYLFILNPDTIVQEDTLATLVRFMDTHPEAGAVGCKILNPDGTFALESRRAFPTPRVAFFRMMGLSRLFPKSRLFGRYNLTYLPIDQVAEVDALSGSCMLVRRAAVYEDGRMGGWEDGRVEKAEKNGQDDDYSHTPTPPASHTQPGAGLFDECFFMYGEDLDWCYRIQQAGWRIFYTPETQIIHYKGESTKKGELRYVKLFYGAMIQFAQKHLQAHYSGLFLRLLRLGVLVRAGLTVLGNWARRLALPLLEMLLVFGTVAGLGVVRSAQTEVSFSPLFYGMVAPAYALCMVVAIGMLGGYRRARRDRLRPVWWGGALALVLMAALSFFVKDIAFSRVVVLAGFPAGALVLSARRLLRRTRRAESRSAILVGHGDEAQRLRRMLAGHPRPPFELVGYVAAGNERTDPAPAVPCLGTLRHLRDLVRLRHIDDVVFAADGLSNQMIFRLMQQLRGLPVQSRILAEGREHVIGKASIADLSTPTLLEAEEALGVPRNRAARRAFEATIAVVGMIAHPLIAGLATLGGDGSFAARLAERTRQASAVLAGRKALIGYHPEAACCPPPEWELQPGVFAVTETLRTPNPTPQEVSQAYWFYVRNQSAFLDWTILTRAIRSL